MTINRRVNSRLLNIWIKFWRMVAIGDIVIYADFDDDSLRGSEVVGDFFLLYDIDLCGVRNVQRISELVVHICELIASQYYIIMK